MSLFAFDDAGSNHRPRGGKAVGHVRRFVEAYRSGETHYYRGSGSAREHVFILAVLNGLFGLKGRSLIQQAYFELAREAEETPVEAVDLVGFGCGAALALHLANLITVKGIPLLSSRQKQEIQLQFPGAREPQCRIVYEFQFQPAPPIRFIGLWDLVCAHEVPSNLGPIPYPQGAIGYRLGIPRAIWNAYHAMALDEACEELPLLHLQGAEEVWFMGGHEQLGGRPASSPLSDIPLQWMLRKGLQSGLSLDPALIESLTPQDLPHLGTEPSRTREVRKRDLVHSSVQPERYPDLPWDSVRRVV